MIKKGGELLDAVGEFKKADSYYKFFDKFGIKKTDNIITARNTFDENHPGECTLYISETTNKTIYDIPDTYKHYGMYLYEVVKEYDEAFERRISHNELVGKVLLVGITYYTADNELVEQKQFYGRVIRSCDKEVCIQQNNGKELSLPGELGSTKRARPGEYRLRSTGEVVVNPDFLSTWDFAKR